MNDERTIKHNAPANFTPQLGDYKTLQPFRYWCQKVLPLVYDDSLSYYEFLCKMCDTLNKVISNQETMENQIININSNLEKIVNEILNEWFNDGKFAKILNETLSEFWVNPSWFGAKFDGTTDDSKAIQTAFNLGNTKFPKNKSTYIGSIVKIPSNRIIDLNWCTLTGLNDYPMFQVSELSSVEPSVYITIKNGLVDLSLSGSFLLCYNAYNVSCENIRINNVHSSMYGFKIVNGFNIYFKNTWVNGTSSDDNTVSKNHAKGIISEIDDKATIEGITNVTNVHFEDCLIQRVEYGVWFKLNGISGAWDTTKMDNMGFSQCDYAIAVDTSTGNNILVNSLRTETCGTAILNKSQLVINSWHIWKCDNCIENYNYLKLDNVCIAKSDNTGNFNFIKDNKGVLDCSGLNYLSLFSDYKTFSDNASKGAIIQSNISNEIIENKVQTLTPDLFHVRTYDQKDYLDFENINAENGTRFKLMSSNNSVFKIANDAYAKGGNSILDCVKTQTGIKISGYQTVIPKELSTINNLTGGEANKILAYDLSKNLESIYLPAGSLVILYSSKANTLLKNTYNTIQNWNGTDIDVHSSPILAFAYENNKVYIINQPSKQTV